MIPTIEIDSQGNITTLYTDEINLYDLGTVCDVRRASNVEFNEKEQVWEVIDASSGNIVYKDKNREKAIDWEIIAFSPGGTYYGSSSPCQSSNQGVEIR